MKDTHTPWQKFRLPRALWDLFGEVVGAKNRSNDLREYVEWRISHPDTPLPKRTRRKPSPPKQPDVTAPTPEQPE